MKRRSSPSGQGARRKVGPRAAAMLLTLTALAAALPAGSLTLTPTLPALRFDGHSLRDDAGRQVTLRGLNVVFKRGSVLQDGTVTGYLPDTEGQTITKDSLNDADAALIASWGFNTVRLGLIWKAVEPKRGVFNEAYLDDAARIVDTLAARGIYTLIDFHQDVFHERYGGEGAPDWALQSPLPATNTGHWSQSYFTPAVMNEYDLFWSNASGIATEYARAWGFVAARFAGNDAVIGYDLFNEPWPGSQWATCASPAGCPAFDRALLQPFYERVIEQIRLVDRTHMLYMSPGIPSNYGAGVNIGPFADPGAGPIDMPQTGLSFHVYCLEGSLDGSFSGQGASCQTLERGAADTQVARARETGMHPLLTEFGASDDVNDVGRVIDLVESAGASSWIYWAYKQYDDPTGSPTQAMLDPETLAWKTAKLQEVARPYAALVAGTVGYHAWDAAKTLIEKTLSLSYDAVVGDTVIVWPRAVHGRYSAQVVCRPANACSVVGDGSGDTVIVRTTAPAHVVVAVSAA